MAEDPRLVKDLAADLQRVIDTYKGVKPETAEGRMVADMQDSIAVFQSLYVDALDDASESFRTTKNTTGDGGVKMLARNKKTPSKQQSANVGRSVKQRSSNSTHVNMPSAAAAELLGIDNLSDAPESVKYAVSVLGGFYQSVESKQPVFGFKSTIKGSNFVGSLIALGVIERGGEGGSAYRKFGDHELRISNHSAHVNNFNGKSEHLSIVLRGNRALNRFLKGENDVIEAVFLKIDLDQNPRKLKALIKDIARFIAYGEYHDTAEALISWPMPGDTRKSSKDCNRA